MDEYGNRSHTKWEYRSGAVFIPKLAGKLFKGLREQLAPMSCRVAEQKERWTEQGHVIPSHVRRILSVPPKRSVSHVAGCIQCKRAPRTTQTYQEKGQSCAGQPLIRTSRDHEFAPGGCPLRIQPAGPRFPRCHRAASSPGSAAGSPGHLYPQAPRRAARGPLHPAQTNRRPRWGPGRLARRWPR